MIRTITPIFSIVIAFVIFFFYTKPLFVEIKRVQGETQAYKDATAKAEERNTELSSKLAKKRSYSLESIERLNALVPQSLDEIKILADLSQIARDHNMLFGNIHVADSDLGAQLKEKKATSQTISYEDIQGTDVQFSLIGTYDQFKAFLADLEKSLVMMEVVQITFSTGEGDLQQYELTIRTFALPPVDE